MRAKCCTIQTVCTTKNPQKIKLSYYVYIQKLHHAEFSIQNKPFRVERSRDCEYHTGVQQVAKKTCQGFSGSFTRPPNQARHRYQHHKSRSRDFGVNGAPPKYVCQPYSLSCQRFLPKIHGKWVRSHCFIFTTESMKNITMDQQSQKHNIILTLLKGVGLEYNGFFSRIQ